MEVLLSSAPAADTAQIVQQWERTYDRQSRLLTERHRMGRTGDWMTLTENVYDAVGRLRAESFGTAITREYATTCARASQRLHPDITARLSATHPGATSRR